MEEKRKQATTFLYSGVMLCASVFGIERLRLLVNATTVPGEIAVIIVALISMVAICATSMVLTLRSAMKLFFNGV